MSSTIFKERRLALGLNLDQISEELRIRKRYLEAIENNDLDQIEFSGFYLKGYMKIYGKYLNITENEISDLLTQHQAEVVVYETRPEVKDPSWSFVTISMISMMFVIFYGKSIFHKISDQLYSPSIMGETTTKIAEVTREDPVKEILGKYITSGKAVIFVKKPTFLKIQGENKDIIFSGHAEAGDVHFIANNIHTMVFSETIDDIELFPEETLVSKNTAITSQLLVSHKILTSVSD